MTARAAAAAANHAPGILVRYGNFLFKYRDQLFPAVLLALFLFTRPHWPAGRDDYDGILDLIGFCVALLGQSLRAAVVGYAYIIRGGRDKKVYAEELVTRGFFNHSRNPLYVGNLLILFGLLIIWNAPIAYVIGVPFFVLGYVAIVAAEEAFLRRKFGAEYDAYAARVPRWWVRLGGFRESMEGMEFNWRRVVLKEYGSAAYWVAGAFALMLADSLVYQPWSAHRVRNTLLVIGIALVVALWSWARWLKKSKRLRA
ncbi:MAG TPA: isoprenylcysteine carboxylmethyltransferase family protein [Gemmatimonadaceae bacterium]|nr:isoprenylcysteine carboxylmethyltransferase family protein [Gemmatimonadaceae bacterium]